MAETTLAGNGKLGINGLGRIGKLALWFNVAARRYSHIYVNIGRHVGRGLDDLIQYISHDSTYGRLSQFLHGFTASNVIEVVDQGLHQIRVDGVNVTFLTKERNPKDIGWRTHGVHVVIDATGRFTDPTVPVDHPGGSLRGHLEAGARLVVNSSAFRYADQAATTPADVVTLIQGINQEAFDEEQHRIISSASCTTTGLAHMMKPLLEDERTNQMLTASMSTIHAATNTQAVLDQAPKAGASDLRKSRSTLNNIILTSTNAARALELVLPEIKRIGFLADSVRVPTQTASLIILNCTFQSRLTDKGQSTINRETINEIYQQYGELPESGVRFSTGQNVSSDIIGEAAAIVIEGHETHTRTGFIDVHLSGLVTQEGIPDIVELPVTHVKLFGWYDNELGSYTRRMSQLTAGLAERAA